MLVAVTSFYASFLIFPNVNTVTTTLPNPITSVQTTTEKTTVTVPSVTTSFQTMATTVTTTSTLSPTVYLNTTKVISTTPGILYFHYDPSLASINGVQTYGAIFNYSSRMGTGKVYSGQTVSLSLFGPQFPSEQNITGVVLVVFYMNSNVANVTGSYQTSLSYVNQAGQSVSIGSSPASAIVLPGGSGNAPFGAFESDISVMNGTVPAGASLVVHLSVSAPNGILDYALIDSTNGPSFVEVP